MPKFSVVIPTRERADTLSFTIQTCLNQKYDDYEIVVCDNCSSLETRQVVDSFASNKIRYVRSDSPLSMSDNWELAVSKSQGEYIIVIGDDDGLLLHALNDLDNLFSRLNTKVIRWNRVYYNWPNILAQPVADQITIPLEWKSTFINADSIVRNIANMREDYTLLPMLYTAAIHRDLITDICKRAGRVFLSISPDIASGFAFAYIVGSYPNIGRPMTINAGSAKSTGVSNSFFADSPIVKDFSILNQTSNIKSHPATPPLSLSSAVADSYLMINHGLFSRDCIEDIDRKNMIKNVLSDCRSKFGDEDQKIRILKDIRESLNDAPKLLEWFDEFILDDKATKYIPASFIMQKGIINNTLYLDGKDFEVHNVYDVAVLYDKLTGHSNNPYQWTKLGATDQSLVQRMRKLARVFLTGQ